MTKKDRDELLEQYMEGKELSEDMVKLFDYVDELVKRAPHPDQTNLFSPAPEPE